MQHAIEFAGITKRFGALTALDGIDLTVAPGEFFGLLGPNGAGKTTLISILAGLARADRGSARVMGYDVRRDYRAARARLGVVPQELVFDPFFTVRETLRITSGYYGIARNDDWIDEIMANLDLVAKADTNMRALSGGMKRRVLVAQALVHRPPVIVLDEPTAGVDVELRRGLWAFVRTLNARGHTIVLTTHYLDEAEALCTRIAMMQRGRMVALDSTANLLRQVDNLAMRVAIGGAPLPAELQSRVLAAEGARYTLRLSSHAEVETVLARLRGAGCAVLELSIAAPDLEDVFVQIMNRGTALPA